MPENTNWKDTVQIQINDQCNTKFKLLDKLNSRKKQSVSRAQTNSIYTAKEQQQKLYKIKKPSGSVCHVTNAQSFWNVRTWGTSKMICKVG